MIDLDRELRESQTTQDTLHHRQDFGIGVHSGHTDNIGIALIKLAISTTLWAFTTEYRRNVITLEGEVQSIFVLRHHTRQGARLSHNALPVDRRCCARAAPQR